MRWLVSKLPHPGPILDPFAGSGTTGEAAEAEGFDAILFDQDPAYVDMARHRLDAARAATPVLTPAGGR